MAKSKSGVSQGEFRFGMLAVLKGYVSMKDLESVLKSQKRTKKKKQIGELLVEKGFLTAEQQAELISLQQQIRSTSG